MLGRNSHSKSLDENSTGLFLYIDSSAGGASRKALTLLLISPVALPILESRRSQLQPESCSLNSMLLQGFFETPTLSDISIQLLIGTLG